jgi:hypothetical protein
MLKKLFLIILVTTCIVSQYVVKKELDIVDDFNGDVEYRLGKLLVTPERTNTDWKKRGDLNFISKNKSKTNKAMIAMSNTQLDKDDQESIHKECLAGGSYIIRIKIGNQYYYSSVEAVYKYI